MMGIYIKGMEMPKSCYACIFFAQTDYLNKEDEADILSRCKRTGEETWESVNGYLPNCPLVPVPPHVELCDKTALVNKIGENIDKAKERNYDWWYACTVAYDFALAAPTIIPAEEGET